MVLTAVLVIVEAVAVAVQNAAGTNATSGQVGDGGAGINYLSLGTFYAGGG
jgi:hypothetical protein